MSVIDERELSNEYRRLAEERIRKAERDLHLERISDFGMLIILVVGLVILTAIMGGC